MSSSNAQSSVSSSPPPSLLPSHSPIDPSVRTHSTQTRAMSGIFNKKVFCATAHPIPQALLADYQHQEPTCYATASKHKCWTDAMAIEFNALMSTSTWSLVPRTPNMNIIGCKWVYKIKKKADGSLDKYKARLVAKGYNQREGIDLFETFSPVIKATTIGLLLSLAHVNGWHMRQLDVQNAFLHGDLLEDVFMIQPPSFINLQYLDHVCKLQKSLYGLKQSPQAWCTKLSAFL